MGSSDAIGKRIQTFRSIYMDTAQGREHLQNLLREHTVVQEIFRNLRKRQRDGEDVSDDVLTHLLPYVDTKGNRERGARISNWPCITKDVRMWFEGAKWKSSEEWPDVAIWLLDIVEAGKSEDWTSWRTLAANQLQKGFACGFITPIVHCLNPNLPVINSKVVKTFSETAPRLGSPSEISAALHDYPDNQGKILDLVNCLKDEGIQGLYEWDIYCHWNVAKRLGGSMPIAPVPLLTLSEVGEQAGTYTHSELDIEQLLEKLEKTQFDTDNPTRFEEALSEAFRALGFDADHIGGAGEADVVARMALGDESFSLIVDAKTCRSGSSRGNINYDPLKGHQEQHEADFAVVVAPSFPSGNTVQHAQNRGVGLLTTYCLIELVRENAHSALSMHFLKEVFGGAGMIAVDLQSHRASREDMTDAVQVVLEIFEAHQRVRESSTILAAEQVYWLSQGRGDKITESQVRSAVELLANPIIGIIEQKESGYLLAIPATEAHTRFASIANALSSRFKQDRSP